MKPLYQRILILLVGLLIVPTVSAVSLHYQTTEMLSVSEPSTRTVVSCTWSCSSSSVSFVTRDNYGNALIQANKYFTGSATITANYTYQYYVPSAGKYETGSGHQSWIVACSPLYAFLSETNITMTVGQRKTLTYTLDTREYGVPVPTWTSSNTRVALVDATGEITAVGTGSATITLNPGFGPSVSCSVTVENEAPPVPTSVSINSTDAFLKVGARRQLTYSFLPVGAQSTVSWSSNNPSVVEVNAYGYISALSQGSAIIKCTTANGKVATKTISTYVLGDVDGDGKVCVADISAIVEYIHGKTLTTNFISKAADFNEDSKVDEQDLKCIEDKIIVE